ncbi:hypothetical protein CDEST_03381 [Colletotrichum destructivum]|uniref:Uncharacterized protein n=1 Tax=Colletotrichum destructivum TaxID=34406 RepID=A0AAX4I4Y2_9PEZI|nr:hypothetical protein CDEST_03381 [Colletotrichum destructivum]
MCLCLILYFLQTVADPALVCSSRYYTFTVLCKFPANLITVYLRTIHRQQDWQHLLCTLDQ